MAKKAITLLFLHDVAHCCGTVRKVCDYTVFAARSDFVDRNFISLRSVICV